MWPALLGGIGVFLLGMGLLTDGLKQWAGDGLRRFLERFAGNRYSAAATGVVATAFIQSSSATSLITIGLVGAGLIALPNAIAILIGANVGTTATAYLVAFVGLKVSVSAWALPLIGLGAFARLFLHGRPAAIASAVTGFGLLFLGIDLMRAAVGDLAEGLDVSNWAGGGFVGALLLVGLGVLMTVLVQSSSAAMATTLATLDAGAITLHDAAFLAIGQNIGTTITAVVGSLGGSVAARRTAMAHVTFNLGTAIPALFLVTPMLVLATRIDGDPVVSLAYFHTTFNLLGLVLFLPLVQVLARALERFVPDADNPLTRSLDKAALQTPGAAEAAIDAAIDAITNEAAHLVRSRMQSDRRPKDWARRTRLAHEALAKTRQYMDQARRSGTLSGRIVPQIGALDHLQHILKDLDLPVVLADDDIRHALSPFVARFGEALRHLEGAEDAELAALTRLRKSLRKRILDRVEKDPALGPDDARRHLEALHWMDRMAWHLRRVLLARPAAPPTDQSL